MANYPFIMLACAVAQSRTEIARQSVTLEFVTQGLLFTVIPGVDKVLITPHIDEALLSKNVPAWKMNVMIMPFASTCATQPAHQLLKVMKMGKSKNGSKRLVDPPVGLELLPKPEEHQRANAKTSVQMPNGEMTEIHARRFYLYRHEDPSGVSGTGKVAEGTEYLCGLCTLNFISPHGHVGTYINMRALTSVHGHGGKTEVIYVDG